MYFSFLFLLFLFNFLFLDFLVFFAYQILSNIFFNYCCLFFTNFVLISSVAFVLSSIYDSISFTLVLSIISCFFIFYLSFLVFSILLIVLLIILHIFLLFLLSLIFSLYVVRKKRWKKIFYSLKLNCFIKIKWFY